MLFAIFGDLTQFLEEGTSIFPHKQCFAFQNEWTSSPTNVKVLTLAPELVNPDRIGIRIRIRTASEQSFLSNVDPKPLHQRKKAFFCKHACMHDLRARPDFEWLMQGDITVYVHTLSHLAKQQESTQLSDYWQAQWPLPSLNPYPFQIHALCITLVLAAWQDSQVTGPQNHFPRIPPPTPYSACLHSPMYTP
jgi:hypothetical protein